MDVRHHSVPESGRCEACGQFFIREASLTKHLRNNCTAAHNRSRELWKNGPSNIKKLKASLTGNPRKRVHDQVRLHDNFRAQVEQTIPPFVDIQDSNHNTELVCTQFLFYLFRSDPYTFFFQDVEIGNASESTEPLPYKRVRRPTWKVLESAPVEPPPSSASSNNGRSSPVEGDDGRVSPIKSVSNCVITPANRFGLVQEYQQTTAVPVSLIIADYFPTYPKTNRDVSRIIYPYPNISSFLFNLAWRRMQGVASSSDRVSIAKVLLDERFKAEGLSGVDFTAIEKQLAADIQSPWGGNGWRRSTLIIEVPTGKKPTAASRRMEANARARNRRHDEVDPDGDPFPVYKVPIHDVRTRSLMQTMLETIQEGRNSTALHWYGHKDVWQPPYRDTPPERVWGELYTSDAFLIAERDLINAHPDPAHPCVIAALMIWSDSTHLAQFGQAKAWPIYAYFGNQSKYTRCKPSTQSAQVIGYVPPVSDPLLFIFGAQLFM